MRSAALVQLALQHPAAFAQTMVPTKRPTLSHGKPSGRAFLSTLVDVSAHAGLSQSTIYGNTETKTYLLESLGCGCAFIDYDNDGWMDVLVLSGTRFSAPPQASNRLYRNNRNGTFTDVTEKAGLLSEGWACGVCIGDYNNDGFEDIFITRWGHNSLYRNNGDGTFTDVTEAAGLRGDAVRWGTGCCFIDTRRNGHLDLFVSNYLEFDPQKSPRPGDTSFCRYGGVGVSCGPNGYPFGRHSLYRNRGDGTFTDVSVASGIATAKQSYGLTAITGDFDDDGWPDIYVACDSSPSLLFLNNHDGTFREEGVLRGVAYSDEGREQSGMGVAVADCSGKGSLDILKTNFAHDLPNLYRNDGKGNFSDEVVSSGLAVDDRFVCWGAGIVDLDNDGAPDLFVVSGNVYPELESRFPDLPEKSPRLLFRNLGQGKFEELIHEAGAAVAELHTSRGCAFGDFDNDGDMDILIVNLNEPPSLLRNDVSGSANWLKIRLVGTRSNRSAIGARVVVDLPHGKLMQEVQSQSSFLSVNDPRLHFGLGMAAEVKVSVRWPNGHADSPILLKANQLVTIREGAGPVPNAGWR